MGHAVVVGSRRGQARPVSRWAWHGWANTLVLAWLAVHAFLWPPGQLAGYALGVGIPVITFRNPVIERYFPEDSVTFVDPASPKNLLSAMRTLALHPDRARQQAERASTIVAKYSWDQEKLRYFDVIDRMLSRRR